MTKLSRAMFQGVFLKKDEALKKTYHTLLNSSSERSRMSIKSFLEVLSRQSVQGQTGCKTVILAENPSLHATVKLTGETLYFIQLLKLIKLNVLYTIVHFWLIQL